MFPRVMPPRQYSGGEVHSSPLPHDEEMRGVAGRDEAGRVEHQRLVGAGLRRLDAGEDAVQLGMRIEFLVLLGRAGAPHMHGEQRDAVLATPPASAACIRG